MISIFCETHEVLLNLYGWVVFMLLFALKFILSLMKLILNIKDSHFNLIGKEYKSVWEITRAIKRVKSYKCLLNSRYAFLCWVIFSRFRNGNEKIPSLLLNKYCVVNIISKQNIFLSWIFIVVFLPFSSKCVY